MSAYALVSGRVDCIHSWSGSFWRGNAMLPSRRELTCGVRAPLQFSFAIAGQLAFLLFSAHQAVTDPIQAMQVRSVPSAVR
jgi:hypothetical protein